MEEECGRQEESRRILQVGLRFSQTNENLMVKAIKVEEKVRGYHRVRQLLSTLNELPIDRTWRMLLEGALFEGRIGH